MALSRLADADAAAQWLRGRTTGTLRTDSRAVRAGDAFLAWPGRSTDGRRFVAAALAAGAQGVLIDDERLDEQHLPDDPRVAVLPGLKRDAGLLADRWFDAPSAALQVVAVTGTNGKTSVAWWTAQALSALGRRCGVIGTLGVGEPPRAGAPAAPLRSTGLTTPDAVMLHATLRRFADDGCAACAMEASSIGIVDHRMAGVRIAVAQFTNFTRDHLDYHGTMADYWAAKRLLFDWPGLRAAVVNLDDEAGAALADELAREGRLALWTYSLRGAASLAGEGLRYVDGTLAFDVREGAARVTVVTGLVGDYNASNLLAVIGALRVLGFTLDEAAGVVGHLSPVPGRLQRVDAGLASAPEVLVDYAHTPDALEKALHALRPLAEARGGRLWCVFGCGGNRDATKRPLMGAIARRLADHVVLTSDNPRDESPALILAQILAGVPDTAADVIEDRRAAIVDVVARAGADDVVLIAGKGHETTQEIAGVKRPFSDVEVAREALRSRATGRGTSA